MKTIKPIYLITLVLLALTLSACSTKTNEQTETAATRLCKDPHQTSPSPVVPQGCVRTGDCRVCGTGWTCWRSDGYCHNHSNGTPYDPQKKETWIEKEN